MRIPDEDKWPVLVDTTAGRDIVDLTHDVSEDYPCNGELWLLLALSEHARGDNNGAIRAAQRSKDLASNERNALVHPAFTGIDYSAGPTKLAGQAQ